MYKQIIEKNRSYVVKSIVNTNDALQVDDSSNSDSSSKYKQSSSKATTSKQSSTSHESSNKNLNAVNEYKSAILNIGSKTKPDTSNKENRKASKMAIITEDEYKATEEWLIEDTKRSKNKRKLKHDNLNLEESEDSYEENSSSSNNDAKNNKFLNENVSPISKKRHISIESPKSKLNEFSNSMINSDSNDSNFDINTSLLPQNKDKMNNLELIDRFLKKSNLNPLTESPDENEIDMADIFTSSEIGAEEPIILQAVKPNTSNQQQNKQSNKYKKQLKINKMDSFNLKSVEKKKHDIESIKLEDDINDCMSERSSSVVSFKTINEQASSNSWKIKANIENRNFLIPVK